LGFLLLLGKNWGRILLPFGRPSQGKQDGDYYSSILYSLKEGSHFGLRGPLVQGAKKGLPII